MSIDNPDALKAIAAIETISEQFTILQEAIAQINNFAIIDAEKESLAKTAKETMEELHGIHGTLEGFFG